MTTPPEYEHEPSLNIKLGELIDSWPGLPDDVVSARGEAPCSTGRVDVLVEVNGATVAVEAKIAREPVSNTARAVEGAVTTTVAEATDDAAWLTWVPLVDDQAALAGRLERVLGRAASSMHERDLLVLTQPLGLRAQDTLAKKHRAAKRVLLAIAAATMFHARLHARLADLPAASRPQQLTQSGAKWRPPRSPGECRAANDLVSAFLEAWELVLMVDYRPIFEAARDALTLMHGNPDFANAVRQVTHDALSLTSQTRNLRYDLLGGVFHRVLDTARYDGSYYTTAAAATLLAGLAIPDDWVDWSDPEAITDLRVCDPACGSGTLLLAALERIERLGTAAGAMASSTGDRSHVVASLIGDSIWGYDINSTATHLAATSLGWVAPDVDFERMCLFHSRFGIDAAANGANNGASAVNGAATVHLGSIDLLPGADVQFETMREYGSHSQVEVDAEDVRAGNPPKMNLVIMNPPFTRDSLRHDQLGPGVEAAMKAEEKKRLAQLGLDARRAARLHSSGGLFAVLAHHLVSETGTLACVLPIVCATSVGNLGYRRFLASHFRIDTIVIPHDPGRIALSGNTNISEMLVIAKRRQPGASPSDDPPTRLVSLLRNPANLLEAHETLAAIKRTRSGELDERRRVAIYEMAAARVNDGDWRQVVFAADWLHDALLRLEANLVSSSDDADGQLLPPTCRRLHDVAPVGPAGQRTRDAYAQRDYAELATGRAGLWQHESDHVTQMAVDPDSWLVTKPDKAELADRYWGQRSRLLLADRIYWHTMRLAAVRLPAPGLGSLWIPVAAADETHEKALCVWLNSTLGVLGLYGRQTLRKLSYPRFGLDDLRELPVPLPRRAGHRALHQRQAPLDVSAESRRSSPTQQG